MKSKPSKLDAHAERLDEWFGIENKTLAEVQAQLAQDSCMVSRSRLSEWWSARQSVQMQDRLLMGIATGSRQVKEVDAAFEKNPAPELATLIKLLKVAILKLNQLGAEDPEYLKLADQLTGRVMDFISGETKATLEKQKLNLQERKVSLLEQKAKQADEAKEVVNSNLSREEKERRIKSIFGMS